MWNTKCEYSRNKKPTSKLIDGKYRNEVFSPSEELSSAIVQLRKQKDVLLNEYYVKKIIVKSKG